MLQHQGSIHRLLMSGLCALALLLGACASSQGNVGNTKVITTASGSIVEVNLDEYKIQMPDSIPAGTTTFKVANIGHHEHNFEIKGNGIDKAFDGNLKEGEKKEMQVKLDAGTYDVICPVGPHATLGMRRTLTVVP
jgi:uncharacterized cupredoxin-like copper-binding protein